MNDLCNVLVLGATGQGKSKAAVRDALNFPGAVVVIDPHKDSLARDLLVHATGDVLYDRLSDLRHPLRFDFLKPSDDPDPLARAAENQWKAEAFSNLLVRGQGGEGMGPLKAEWVTAASLCFLHQSRPRSLLAYPFAYMPGTEDFASLVADCTLEEVAYKFRQLQGLSPRALRAEVGPAARLVNPVFRSPAFRVRCGGGFDLGGFLQKRGKLILERGEDIGDDTMRMILGSIILLVWEHAKRRPRPEPPILLMIDEATNAGLASERYEQRGAKETRKLGLHWDYRVQNLDFPGGPESILQNCKRHEVFGCASYDVARKAATDIAAGLPVAAEESRAERIARLTDDIMNLPPGWRWVRDARGSRREYVPLLENPWPDWPGLREGKLGEKLCTTFARPEYGANVAPPSSTSSAGSPPPPSSSPGGSSPAERWKRKSGKPGDGSKSSGGGSASA
jgi:hypothetical protein